MPGYFFFFSVGVYSKMMIKKKIQGVYKLVPEVFVIIRYCALSIIICAILFTVDCTNTIGLFLQASQ